jgi:UDPglucose--hexose-1-phosphate uridylyltransferase
MPQLRKDLIHERWVALADSQALKPEDFPIAKQNITVRRAESICPFCAGHEYMTPAAVETVGESDWQLRVVPNKYTAFSLQGELAPGETGVYAFMNSLGIHEVVIETPQHALKLQDYSREHVAAYLQLLRRRYAALAQDERIQYIQIYRNQGMLAGATVEHSHSQILGFPFLPAVNAGGARYYREHRRCLFCALLEQDMAQRDRVIYEGTHFVLLCPYAACYPYGIWLAAKEHICHITEFPEAAMQELALLLQVYVGAMLKAVGGCSYNIIVNTSPVNQAAAEGYHWYMEINPRLTIASAVEVASGIHMNPVAPELAAVMLRRQFLADLREV